MGRVEEALRRVSGNGGEDPAGVPASHVEAPAFPTEDAGGPDRSVEVGGSGAVAAAGADDTPMRGDADRDGLPSTMETQRNGAEEGVAARLIGSDEMLAISREQYRRLAATLHHMQAVNGIKVVLIASALAGEGKTLTASNLALTFSESYDRHVLLIDADLRRPSLARTFGIPSTPGLSDGLGRGFEQKLAPRTVSDRLMVLPAGNPMTDPMAGLTSVWMQRLIAEARESFDWVIIDTPPVALMTDANLLAAMADGVVLVVKAGATPYQMVKRAIDAIGRDRFLGTVLNRATRETAEHGYYYYGYKNYAKTYGNQASGQ